ncbi:MAG: hypothetical protein CMF23_16075 [Ignavibacteriae bacterium]|nr:hypothetical protein [Ignavibacteriota bacterium]
MEDWVTIKNLRAKNPNMSLRQISKLLGVSHNTVKQALVRDSPPEYKREGKVSDKIVPFEKDIYKMVDDGKFIGSRIYNEIKSKGYTGSKTTFYYHYQKIKKINIKSFTPYETSPGEQGQFDWSPYTVNIGGIITKIYLYSYVHGFSRYQVLEVSLSENQTAVFEALENSMIESGGVCSRIQTDNAKVFVKNASKNNFQWNKHYLNFCGHYGFTPSRSFPRHPWSKGKVEKPFYYVENHFIKGGEFESFEDLHKKLKKFQQEYNQRTHSVVKTEPYKLFEKEKSSLLPLPQYRYVGIKEEIRKSSYDCLISYNGSKYSVPWQYAGKHLWVKVSKGYYLEVYSQANKLAARHKISLKKGSVIIEQSHYRGNNQRGGNFNRLKEIFLESFPDNELFIEKLRAQKRINANYQLSQIIELAKLYRKEDFIEAINKSLLYNVFNFSFMAGYLEKSFKHTFELQKIEISKEYQKINIRRNLSYYRVENNINE